VVQERPLVVRGIGFKRVERVTVVLVSTRTWTRSVTADATGAFTLRFRVSIARCQPYSLQAFGSKGSRARTLPPRRAGCDSPDGTGLDGRDRPEEASPVRPTVSTA